MQKKAQKFDRITISLPIELSRNINALKKELKVSKSEILKIALEKFLEEQKKRKLEKIAHMMTKEYETNKELTEFTILDSEDFK